jgi:spore maturation protein CgeB
VGNNYGNIFPDSPLRVQAVATCTNNFGGRFGIFGGGWANNCHQIEPPKANEIYNKSVCALSISNFNSVAHYFSDRLLYCLASGRPTIAWYFPGAENYFIEGSEIFYARSHQDIVNIVNYCKSNPKEATLVGMNGQKRVFKEHTYTSRIIELLHMTNLIDKV